MNIRIYKKVEKSDIGLFLILTLMFGFALSFFICKIESINVKSIIFIFFLSIFLLISLLLTIKSILSIKHNRFDEEIIKCEKFEVIEE